MIKLLSKIFIKDNKNYTDRKVRQKYGMLCGGVGIFLNVLLFISKFLIGTLTNSIAIVADAINNLSDAGSSAVSLLGFKIAGQKPDPEHPFGHGRVEYITGLIISMAILLMGFELLKNSVGKIFAPEETVFDIWAVVILVIAITVKLYMFLYNRNIAKKINSASMKATATDSISDCLATTAVLLSVIISKIFNINLDPYFGVLVSLFILYAGFNAGKETISPLLGQKPDAEFVKDIEKTVMAHGEVKGIHDLIVHDYGPGRVMISLHAEVSDNENILKIHDVIDNIEKELSENLDCHAVIHMDPISTDDESTNSLKLAFVDIIKDINEEFTLHDFRVVRGDTHTNIIFDIVVPFEEKTPNEELKKQIDRKAKEINPTYFTVINVDRSYV